MNVIRLMINVCRGQSEQSKPNKWKRKWEEHIRRSFAVRANNERCQCERKSVVQTKAKRKEQSKETETKNAFGNSIDFRIERAAISSFHSSSGWSIRKQKRIRRQTQKCQREREKMKKRKDEWRSLFLSHCLITKNQQQDKERLRYCPIVVWLSPWVYAQRIKSTEWRTKSIDRAEIITAARVQHFIPKSNRNERIESAQINWRQSTNRTKSNEKNNQAKLCLINLCSASPTGYARNNKNQKPIPSFVCELCANETENTYEKLTIFFIDFVYARMNAQKWSAKENCGKRARAS